MKKILFAAVLALPAFISSCYTEEVKCAAGKMDVYGVGFDAAKVYGGILTRYVANTDSPVSSMRIAGSSVGKDTMTLFTAWTGYDYKLSLNDSSVYFFNHITLPPKRTQSVQRNIFEGKKIGCIMNIVACDVNGKRHDVGSFRPDAVYILP